jgi:hypothetical protein
MKPVPAIIETDIVQLEHETRAAIDAHREASARATELEQQAAAAREAARMRLFEIGRLLIRARAAWPKTGPRAKGWGEYLQRLGVDQPRAWEWMQYAGYVEVSSQSDETRPAPSDMPTFVEAGVRSAPPPQHIEPEIEIDRDTWCTPKWVTDAIGRWDLDPCANVRSHVDAARCFMLEECGEDGLVLARDVKKTARVFINPPYSDVMPWIEAYGHTRFCFLLKLDISTKWFEALLAKCELVLMPRRTRIQFEAPPGIPPEKALANQFPHALFYARAADATDAIKALCFPGWFPNRG